MKRFWAFIAVFLTVLTIGYLEPVFFPADKPKEIVQNGGQVASHTALPYEEIKTSGYAAYIGKKTADFTSVFGEPKEKIQTDMNYELWLFGDSDKDYTEVNVREDQILSIKAFGQPKQTSPFHIGMQLSDLSALMTIYSNFSFKFQNEAYNIELTEEDMNYRPLIAFDNGSFGVLFFNQDNGGLAGIAYMDRETLVTEMPYQLNEGTLLPIERSSQSKGFDGVRSNQAIRVINLLKTSEEQSAFRVDTTSQKEAQLLYDSFEKNNQTILSSERRAILLQAREDRTALNSFTLSNDEFGQLVKASKLALNEPTGIYKEPVYDSSFTILSWFSDPLYHARFNHEQNEDIGVAFSQENMLVLIQSAKEKTQMTESSE